MAKYRIEYDRENCIGAGACVAANPDWWSIDPDGKATLKSASFDTEKKTWVLQVEEADFQKHMDAAGVCPVTVIHIFENETDKKLI